MTDRLFVTHPEHLDRNGYVSQSAFDVLWSKKGYVVVDAPAVPTEDDLNAELDRRAGLDPAAEPADAPESPEDEAARLTAQLQAAGITVDGRWKLRRLRIEAANLTGDEDFD